MVNKLTNTIRFDYDATTTGTQCDSTHSTEDEQEDFFECFAINLNRSSSSRSNTAAEEVSVYLTKCPSYNISSCGINACVEFPSDAFKKTFIQLNTAIPSSAAVERIFSTGKDILKPKRSGLSDVHFEQLMQWY